MMPPECMPFERGVREGLLIYVRRLVTFVKIFLMASIVCGAVGYTFILLRGTAVRPSGTDHVGVVVPTPQPTENRPVTPEVRPSPPNKTNKGKTKAQPVPRSKTPDTEAGRLLSGETHSARVDFESSWSSETSKETAHTCKAYITLNWATGKLAPDLTRKIKEFLKQQCDRAAANLKVGEASMTLVMTFGLQADGSVAKNSIRFGQGIESDPFGEAVKKAVANGGFPTLATEDGSGVAADARFEMSYSPTKHDE
jgi:hypothetical protein